MNRSLRIAMLAPLKRPITVDTTVSRNRVMVDLASELVRLGHQITIFGTGDSVLPGVAVRAVIPQALTRMPTAENPFYQHTAALTRLITSFVKEQDQFDLVHNHAYPEFLPLLASSQLRIPMVTTIHSQMTTEMQEVLQEFPDTTLVALSKAAQEASEMPMEVISNGIDTEFFVPDTAKTREYLLFIGRMSGAKDAKGAFLDPKGVTDAIAVAEKIGENLKIIGSVEDPAFFETLVRPHLSPTIEFVGEVSGEQQLTREAVRDLYQGAKALLFPIQWEEPFGLVMAEAMACGVPVVAYARGSTSEIVRDGLNGCLVDPKAGVEGLTQACSRAPSLASHAIRDDAVARFSKHTMALSYLQLYERLIGSPKA